MGTQRPVVIGEVPEELGGPIAEHHGKKNEKVKSKKEKVTEKIKEAQFGEEKTAEKTAVKKVEAVQPEANNEKPKKKIKQGKTKVRSKKYQSASALIDPQKQYNFAEAIDLVQKTSLTRFDGTVEAHIRLLGKSGKAEKLRGFLKYPHATGRKIVVATLDDKTIEEIEKTGQAPADIYLATPAQMAKVAKLAKILGPKGKMPNPKAGTITGDPEKTKVKIEGGQTEYKTDSYGNIHQVIGKVSAEPKILEENFKAFLAALPTEKIVSINLCATMGPAVKVQK